MCSVVLVVYLQYWGGGGRKNCANKLRGTEKQHLFTIQQKEKGFLPPHVIFIHTIYTVCCISCVLRVSCGICSQLCLNTLQVIFLSAAIRMGDNCILLYLLKKKKKLQFEPDFTSRRLKLCNNGFYLVL